MSLFTLFVWLLFFLLRLIFLFEHIVRVMIDQNILFFFDSQTHTMSGSLEDPELSGIAPRAIHEIFARVAENSDLTATITCNMIELYLDNLVDLFGEGLWSSLSFSYFFPPPFMFLTPSYSSFPFVERNAEKTIFSFFLLVLFS